MNIIVVSTGQTISGGDLLSAIFRTDLVPVPVTLELNVKRTADLEKALVTGAELLIGDPAISLVIAKSIPASSQMIAIDSRIGGIACVAVLKGCERFLESMNHAVVLTQTTFGGIYKACGAKVRVADDLPLSEFVCLKGQLATKEIAKRLQQEAAVVKVNTNGSISFLKLDALMKAAPVAKYDPSAVTFTNSPKIEAIRTPAYYSINSDGSTVENENPTDNKPLFYKPRLDTRQLKNLEKVLIRRGVMMRPLDLKLFAGNLIEVGQKNYVVLTSAHRVDTGSLGGPSVMATKVWLSSL